MPIKSKHKVVVHSGTSRTLPPSVKAKKLIAKKKEAKIIEEVEDVYDDLDEDEQEVTTSKKKKAKLKVEDSEAFVSRTKEVLAKLDAERALNPMTEDSDANYEFYRAALAETLEMVPLAKQGFMRFQNQSNAYAYNALVTKCQELIADLEALSDKSNLLDKLLDQFILPSFMGITANLGNAYTLGASEIKALGLSSREQDKVLAIFTNMIRNSGSYLQDTQNGLINSLRGQMSEDD